MLVQLQQSFNSVIILKDPEYVAVHEYSKTSTPKGLVQVWQRISYMHSLLDLNKKGVFLCAPLEFIILNTIVCSQLA